MLARYFVGEQKAVESLETDRDKIARQMEELEEKHGGGEGLMVDTKNDRDKITKANAHLQKNIGA